MAICTVFLCYCQELVASPADDANLYVTGKVMEIDRCASAWLIKKHVNTAAGFDFLDDEDLMRSSAIQFDTPFAALRRTHRLSTFESIIEKYSIKNGRVTSIAAMIHDIEINFWNKQEKRDVQQFEHELKQIIETTKDNTVALQGCFKYLDSLKIPTN
jgi:hypothetical protein